MTKYNLIDESEKYWRLKGKINYVNQLKTSDKILITKFYQSFKSLKGKELIKYVYENYPYYSINSTIKETLLDKEQLKAVENSKPNESEYTLYSMGYEGKTVESFTNELIKENIRILCDIRKNALSMKYGFSKNQLKFMVENVEIKYIHIPELGIDSIKRQNLNSKEDYDKLFRDYEKKSIPERAKELEELNKIFISNKRIAIMCFKLIILIATEVALLMLLLINTKRLFGLNISKINEN